MSTPPSPSKPRRRIAIVAAVGAGLAVVCHFVPPQYQAACHLLASICTGGAP